jgi:hypothetical protein
MVRRAMFVFDMFAGQGDDTVEEHSHTRLNTFLDCWCMAGANLAPITDHTIDRWLYTWLTAANHDSHDID